MGFAIAVLVGLVQGVKPFYGDSGDYWLQAALFTQHGHFSLLNFENPNRGYAMALITYVLGSLTEAGHASQSTILTLFIALLFALIGAVLAPRLAEITWPEQHWGFSRRLLLSGLLLFFWHGDLNYPLSDFPGLAMAFIGLVTIARVDSPGWMFVAGAAGALAIDLRPAYLPFLPMLVLIMALSWRDRRGSHHDSRVRRALGIGLLLVGFTVMSLPQSLLAHRYFNTWSFVPGATAHLGESRLDDGMGAQRFDGYETPHAQGAITYPDPAGQALLRQQPGGMITSSSQYLGLIISHPIEMSALLARRAINGLDVRYSTIYVEHLNSGGYLWLRLPGFLLVFLALVRLLWSRARRGLGRSKWRYPIALSACGLTAITTRVETRYMLPFYLLIYMLVLAPGWPNPIGPAQAGLRRFRTPLILGFSYLVFMAIIWHVVGHLKLEII